MYLYLFLFCALLLSLGCTESEKSPGVIDAVDVTEAETEVTTTASRIQGMTEEERGKQVIVHLKKYLELKERSPNAAYTELRKAADYSWWAHPLADAWTQLVFRIDKTGKVSIMDMIQRTELELQMAKDYSPYKEQITYLEGRVQFWRKKKEFAEGVGNDPNEANIKWSIRVEDD